MTVEYRMECTGRTATEVRERLLTQACPSCGVDWRPRGAATPRHEGRRTYRCTACGDHHRATEVDDRGRAVISPGSWGVTQQHRLRKSRHSEAAPSSPTSG